MGMIRGSQSDGYNAKEGSVPQRRCNRLKDTEDVRIEDLAKERAADSEPSLLHMPDLVGIDLGCSIDMVEHNLDVINKMEQSKKDFYFYNINNRKCWGA